MNEQQKAFMDEWYDLIQRIGTLPTDDATAVARAIYADLEELLKYSTD